MKGMVDVLRRVVRSSRRLRARVSARGRLRVGRDFVVGPAFRLGRGRTLRAADRVSIGPNFHCMTNAVFGDDVMLSASVAFVGNDHAFDDPTQTIQTQGRLPYSTVHLEGDNLIGFGTIVVGNVRIGRRTIVGAGSLVTTDLPPETICVGRPARPIRSRFRVREAMPEHVPATATS
jgi:acetyltransferase-like isoleucine patch superfamily enzyme